MPCDAEQRLEDACDSGIASLSVHQLWIVAAQMACGGSVPPTATFHILLETGDVLTTEGSDQLRTE